jgi:hypothetical protein
VIEIIFISARGACFNNCSKGKGKGKVVSRAGHEGPEEEQWYNSTHSLLSVLDRGVWST